MKFITTEIRGGTYKLAKLSPVIGAGVAIKVGALLASVAQDADGVKAIAEAYQVKGGEGLMGSTHLLSALAGGVAKIDAAALYELALQCVRGNLFADKKLHDDDAINAHFEDHPDRMLLVLAWALRENCAGFFGLGGTV